jgi:energy-coupling factor transport system substrate-specific component
MSPSISETIVSNKTRLFLILGLALLGGLCNALLGIANAAVDSPFFFDSIFTATAGALWGPWAGLLCAFATHFFIVAFHGWGIEWWYFLPCGMATGAIVGAFGKIRGAKDVTAIILCAISVTLANSLLGAIIAVYAYGGITAHPSDYIVTGLILAGQSILGASFWARIPINLIDKGIAVILAFVAKRYIRI